MALCQGDDCFSPAARGGPYCYACAKRRQRAARGETISLRPLRRPKTARERLREAAIRYADADSEDEREFERADDNLRKAALALAASLKRPWQAVDPRAALRRMSRRKCNTLVGVQGELFPKE